MDEFSEYKLIDIDNGNIIKIDGIPILSPDGKFVATYYNDIGFESDMSLISIYRVNVNNISIVFNKTFGYSCGPSKIGWSDICSLEFEIQCADKSNVINGKKYEIIFVDNRWKLHEK